LPGDDPLHPGVFRLELLEPYEVAGLQSGVLIAPVADCARVTPCFRASSVAGTAGELLENSDDLRFAEATLFHVSLLSPKGQTHNFNLRRFPTSRHHEPRVIGSPGTESSRRTVWAMVLAGSSSCRKWALSEAGRGMFWGSTLAWVWRILRSAERTHVRRYLVAPVAPQGPSVTWKTSGKGPRSVNRGSARPIARLS